MISQKNNIDDPCMTNNDFQWNKEGCGGVTEPCKIEDSGIQRIKKSPQSQKNPRIEKL